MDLEIGKAITKLRLEKNLSIHELSKKTNVTASMLSQVERGIATPSLGTLRSIAAALDKPMFSFFMPPVNPEDLVIKAADRKKIILPDNGDLEYQLLSPDLSGVIEMVLLKLPPHRSSSDSMACHEGEEIAYMIEGELRLHIGESVFTVQKGDSAKIPGFTKHKFENPGEAEAVILFAISPPSF